MGNAGRSKARPGSWDAESRREVKLTMMGEEPSNNADVGVALAVSFHVMGATGRGRGRGESCPA